MQIAPEKLLDHLASPGFHDACRAVNAELEAGADLAPEQMAERLGVPLPWLMCAAGAYRAARVADRTIITRGVN